jgi:hypothetical protein
LTFDFEWAELPDDIAHRKQHAWQQWERLDHQLLDPPTRPRPARRAPARAAGRLEAVLARRRRPLPPLQPPDGRCHHRHGTGRHGPAGPGPTLPPTSQLRRQQRRLRRLPRRRRPRRARPAKPRPGRLPRCPGPAPTGQLRRAGHPSAQAVDQRRLAHHPPTSWTPPAPTATLDHRKRPIPWWTQWLDYLDGARGHGGVRVH